jgi:hypothetical protein
MDYKNLLNKFSFAQMTSNSSGKTSASGTMGCLICTVGAISFAWGTFSKQNEVLMQSIILVGIGAGLLGYRKSKDSGVSEIEESPKEEMVAEENTGDQPLNS